MNQPRLRSLLKNARRRKQENVSACACPGSLRRLQVFRWRMAFRPDREVTRFHSRLRGIRVGGKSRRASHAHAKPWAWHPKYRLVPIPGSTKGGGGCYAHGFAWAWELPEVCVHCPNGSGFYCGLLVANSCRCCSCISMARLLTGGSII